MGNLERETGIEPATNSLEGCDSTTELLPPTQLATAPTRCYGGQARRVNFQTPTRSASCRQTNNATNRTALSTHGLRGWWGGEGRTSVALRRQVYSLLRLTALPPPRIFVSSKCSRGPRARVQL